MQLNEFLRPEDVILGLRIGDKPQLLAELSRRAGVALALDPASIERALIARERLGSTGLGRGFALPHARLPEVKRFFGLFARLARPIEFEAIDAAAVDLVFLLLLPEQSGNLQVGALAAVSRRMRDPALLTRLRKASDPAQAYGMLTEL